MRYEVTAADVNVSGEDLVRGIQRATPPEAEVVVAEARVVGRWRAGGQDLPSYLLLLGATYHGQNIIWPRTVSETLLWELVRRGQAPEDTTDDRAGNHHDVQPPERGRAV